MASYHYRSSEIPFPHNSLMYSQRGNWGHRSCFTPYIDQGDTYSCSIRLPLHQGASYDTLPTHPSRGIHILPVSSSCRRKNNRALLASGANRSEAIGSWVRSKPRLYSKKWETFHPVLS